jgi:hypothetical protein
MRSLFYFSDYIKPIAKRIRFFLIVCGRFFIVLFRWRKSIKLLHLDYTKKNHFNSSYLIIRYRFKNALWYNFKSIKKTIEDDVIVLNLMNVSKLPIELTVYGFFRRKTLYISIKPENTLQNDAFKTVIKGVNEIKSYNKSIIAKVTKPIPTLSKIRLNHSGIQINSPSYNQNDFL